MNGVSVEIAIRWATTIGEMAWADWRCNQLFACDYLRWATFKVMTIIHIALSPSLPISLFLSLSLSVDLIHAEIGLKTLPTRLNRFSQDLWIISGPWQLSSDRFAYKTDSMIKQNCQSQKIKRIRFLRHHLFPMPIYCVSSTHKIFQFVKMPTETPTLIGESNWSLWSLHSFVKKEMMWKVFDNSVDEMRIGLDCMPSPLWWYSIGIKRK